MTARTANASPAPVVEDAYDPGDYTVAEVQAYVRDHPDERETVLDAETAGKNRVTLVSWLEELE